MRSMIAAAAMVFAAAWALPAGADTLDDILARGHVNCGLSGKTPGFSMVNAQGVDEGFEVDYCRALAAAVFGDGAKVKLTPLLPRDAFTTLASGAVDVFASRATWTFLRDTSLGFDYAGIYFYDGQGFMVPKDANIKEVADLDGATVCVTQGTTSELNLADYFGAAGLKYEIVSFADFEETKRAYFAGRCDTWSLDRVAMATRTVNEPERVKHEILPHTISREPLGPIVRHGDNRWKDIVTWVLNVKVAAEALGITQTNVDDLRASSKNGEIQRILGVNGEFGSKLGLGNEWAYNVIKTTGNYAESFDRHIGANTPLSLDRGLTALWRDGGVQYPLPFR